MLAALKSSISPRRFSLRPLHALKAPCWSQRLFSTTTARYKKVDHLLSSLTAALYNPRSIKNILKFVHKQLDEHFPQTPAPHYVYEQVISLLIEKRLLAEADSVYARMLTDGLVSASETDAKILAIAFAQTDGSQTEPLMHGLGLLFQLPDFQDEQAVRLLRLMGKLEVAPGIILAVVNKFMCSRPEGYTPSRKLVTRLVDAQARAGKVDEAVDTLTRFEKKSQLEERKLEAKRRAKEATQYPYAALISAIRQTGAGKWDQEAVLPVLKIMEDAGIRPGVPIFNNLISAEVHTRQLQDAFSLYRLVKSTAAHGIEPNAATFRSLFSALGQLYNPRVGEARRHRRVNFVVPPRQLYYDMVATLAPPTPGKRTIKEPKEFSSALEVAIRAFLSIHDYAGAFVVLSTFRVNGLPISLSTYTTIVKHLMFRLKNDIMGVRRLDETRWGDRFLGFTEPLPIQTLLKVHVNRRMLQHILEVAKAPSFGLISPFYTIKDREIVEMPEIVDDAKYVTPTPGMMNEIVPVPSDMQFSHVPLERILRRMILTSYPDVIASSSRQFRVKWQTSVARARTAFAENSKTDSVEGVKDAPPVPFPYAARIRKHPGPPLIGPLLPGPIVSEAIVAAKAEMIPQYSPEYVLYKPK